jgi:uncharacterized protein (TIGR03067 family)
VQFKNIRIKTFSRSSAKSDLDAIQGHWVPVEFIGNGNPAPADDLARVKLEVKGQEYVVQRSDGEDKGRFELFPDQQPKRMDVTTNNGDRMQAIYELSGDTMRVCYGINGAPRPTEFKSTDGSNQILAVYKRMR